MQAQGHHTGWSGRICRNYPSRAEGRTLRQREQCVQRLRGVENRGKVCGTCVSEFLQLGAEWVGEDRGGDTEKDHPQPPGAQPGGIELPSEVPRVQNEATLPGLQCVGGLDPCQVDDVVWAPRQLLQAWRDGGRAPWSALLQPEPNCARGRKRGERFGETSIGTS